MVWLTSQSVWLLVVGCLVVAVVVAFGSRYLALWILPAEEREEAHSIAAALMTAFAAAFALLTALTLANEVSSLSSAQTTVSAEAAAASALAWSSTNPGVQSATLQTALRNYLVATRTFEWHGAASANGDDSQTANALAVLERTVRAQAARPEVGSATSTELLTNMDELTSQRRIRIADAGHSIPDFYAVLVVVVGLALIVNTSIVGIRGGLRASLVTISLSIVIALSIALLFSLATPWRGAIQVSGHPIDTVITDLNTNYFHS
jgi:hypothetical protein